MVAGTQFSEEGVEDLMDKLRKRSAITNQLKSIASTDPGIIHSAPIPVLNAVPTIPRVTQPLSADADDESAATQAPSPRLARKKSEDVARA